jgi:hypothetical protein
MEPNSRPDAFVTQERVAHLMRNIAVAGSPEHISPFVVIAEFLGLISVQLALIREDLNSAVSTHF